MTLPRFWTQLEHFRVNFDQSPWTEGVCLIPTLLKFLFLVGKVVEVPVATFCASKLLSTLISAFGEWLPLLGGSAVPSFLLPALTGPALCLCPWGEQEGCVPGGRAH